MKPFRSKLGLTLIALGIVWVAFIGAKLYLDLAKLNERPIEEAAKTVVVVYTAEVGEDMVHYGSGSGVAIDKRGYILTCWHVVDGASHIMVEWDGRRAAADIVAHDQNLDLAILKIENELSEIAPWGDSDKLHVGDGVYAIGFAFDVTKLVRFGVIASISLVMDSTYFLVTDAAVNPGDSGGGLFDAKGRLVGISARIQTVQGLRANIGLSYIIPGNVARWFVQQNLSQKAH